MTVSDAEALAGKLEADIRVFPNSNYVISPEQRQLIVAALRTPIPVAVSRDTIQHEIETLKQLSEIERKAAHTQSTWQLLRDIAARLESALPAVAVSREDVARIIDPTAFSMKPSAYGLKTEKEMLGKTLVGAVRAVAYEKADAILSLQLHDRAAGVEK